MAGGNSSARKPRGTDRNKFRRQAVHDSCRRPIRVAEKENQVVKQAQTPKVKPVQSPSHSHKMSSSAKRRRTEEQPEREPGQPKPLRRTRRVWNIRLALQLEIEAQLENVSFSDFESLEDESPNIEKPGESIRRADPVRYLDV